ncbi:MAG: cytidylate kinase family protein [Thermodesulfovibrionales bacterium]|nr:cytidylate kinase family protein [Thermodesulfovibrionales bacterium]
MAILTISREFGSGGREIGLMVAKSLNYEYVNKERLLADIHATGKEWEEYGKHLDEHCPTIWEKYDWSFRGFTALLQSLILNYALNDKVVIMGRGGNFLLKDIPYALRVRVTGPIEQRVERIIKRESFDRNMAHWLIEKTDKERACFIHLIYGKHWDSPEEYDMVLDGGSKTLDELTAIVKKALLEKDRFKTEDAKNKLMLRSLAAKIKAELLTDPSFFIPTLDVIYDGKEILLRGVIHTPKEHKRIEEKAKELAGDVPIKCELHYRG